LKQKLFLGFFFQNPSHFHRNWLIFEGLTTKANLNQIQIYFGFDLLKRKPVFEYLKIGSLESSIHPTVGIRKCYVFRRKSRGVFVL
jgi:hypothetical protein